MGHQLIYSSTKLKDIAPVSSARRRQATAVYANSQAPTAGEFWGILWVHGTWSKHFRMQRLEGMLPSLLRGAGRCFIEAGLLRGLTKRTGCFFAVQNLSHAIPFSLEFSQTLPHRLPLVWCGGFYLRFEFFHLLHKLVEFFCNHSNGHRSSSNSSGVGACGNIKMSPEQYKNIPLGLAGFKPGQGTGEINDCLFQTACFARGDKRNDGSTFVLLSFCL